MKKYYERYKHAIPLIIYAVIYCTWFVWLEKSVVHPENIIHMKIDDMIPFCELFVIPYFLWFGYVSIIVLYCFFKNKQEYYKTCVFLFTGMTAFLIISTLWPNGHHLRPYIMPRDNIFSSLVAHLYSMDTPANLWPSIHVYNSIGAHLAVVHNQKLAKNKVILISSFILCVSIVLSTVFIKQHSMFDVFTAFVMAATMYVVVYQADIVAYFQWYRWKRQRLRQV
ncbi:MAG: serine/threonine protein phosphatase [Lachnospiraceae bacterium]|nr:serine/threonine protein phosphatase [Lachnospiraceae bacterium]MDE7332425.1 serine/threonine protein phosphatase [Lachnospiraceae bacterium]